MQTETALDRAKGEILCHYDAFYGEDYDQATALMDAVVTAAQSGSQGALDSARSEFHLHYRALYGDDYTHLTGLLDDLVAAAA
ncbi:hypothetical protein [Streptomyces muensis]|uniref:Uncharacterized protein n=1 Tax=Streptomyces muensis TaxID=1077944 RepID=A0A9X1PTY0_STRM4|nr:hypothetical protein [Streptomyces muensis]MCF1592460.1 hypothetical protein [Streptomyces muensis]